MAMPLTFISFSSPFCLPLINLVVDHKSKHKHISVPASVRNPIQHSRMKKALTVEASSNKFLAVSSSNRNTKLIAVYSAVTIVLAVADRVLYKLALVPLKQRYNVRQIIGCLLVAAGVIVAVSSGSGGEKMLYGVQLVWPTLMIASTALQAGASILKEYVFIDAAARLKGNSLDIFVVNSFGSGFQALFVLLFLPFLSKLKGIPFSELPSYLKSGVACFLNIGASIEGCEGAPLLPLIYVATNIAFNISVLNLVKISTAVVASLAMMLSVPLSIYILSLPLPYLSEGASLGPFFLFGSFSYWAS